MRGRSERIIGFELDHRPDDNAHRRERLLERMELREQRGLDAVAGLVVRPKPIAKRLDHVVGGDAEIRVAALDHLEHGLQHADDGAVRAVHAFVEPAQAVEVTEELVGAVDEVNDHFVQPNSTSRRKVRASILNCSRLAMSRRSGISENARESRPIRSANGARFSRMFRWIIRMVIFTFATKLLGKYFGARGVRPPR